MKHIKLLFFIVVVSFTLQTMAQTFPKDVWGVYSWVNYNSKKVNPEKTPHVKGGPLIIHWNKL